jgi:hypothetical protein
MLKRIVEFFTGKKQPVDAVAPGAAPYKVEAPAPVPVTEPAAPLAADQAAEASAVTLTPVANTPPAKKPAVKKPAAKKPAAIKAPAKTRTKKTP